MSLAVPIPRFAFSRVGNFINVRHITGTRIWDNELNGSRGSRLSDDRHSCMFPEFCNDFAGQSGRNMQTWNGRKPPYIRRLRKLHVLLTGLTSSNWNNEWACAACSVDIMQQPTRPCNSFHFTSLLVVSYSCPSTWHYHFFIYYIFLHLLFHLFIYYILYLFIYYILLHLLLFAICLQFNNRNCKFVIKNWCN